MKISEIAQSTPQSLALLDNAYLLPATLSKQEKDIIQIAVYDTGKDNRKIEECSAGELSTSAALIFEKANTRFGNTIKEPDQVTRTVREITRDLSKFPLLRLKEIKKALEMGLDGDFDTENVYHFSSVGFVRWIKAYIEMKRPIMKKKAQIDHQSVEAKKPTEAEEKKILEDGFNWHISKYENGQSIQMFEGIDSVFERCEKLRVFDPLDIEEKTKIYEECKNLVPNHSKEQLVVLARKVAYLYVIHQASMIDFTIESLIQAVRKTEVNQLHEKERIDFYKTYKQQKNESDQNV